VDADGSGTALRLTGGEPIKFSQAKTKSLDRFGTDSGTIMTCLYVKLARWPEAVATLVLSQYGRFALNSVGKLLYCSAKENDCVLRDQEGLSLNEYHFLCASIRFTGASWEVNIDQYTQGAWLPSFYKSMDGQFQSHDLGVSIGDFLSADIDLLSISGKKLSGFDEADRNKFRTELVPRSQIGLEFALWFDLKRGNNLYDEKQLANGNFKNVNGSLVQSNIALTVSLSTSLTLFHLRSEM
jgi:hypothetical protein